MDVRVKLTMWNGCQGKMGHVTVRVKGTMWNDYHGKRGHVEWLSE